MKDGEFREKMSHY